MTSNTGTPMKIFLAHAKEDEPVTLDIYNKLKLLGFSPWMDIQDIPGGVDWDHEIQKNFSSADVIIIIVSHTSNTKNGYIRREINDTLAKLAFFHKDCVFAIPLLIDDSTIPESIRSKLQVIDYKLVDGFDKLKASLLLAAKQRGIEINSGVFYGDLEVKTNIFEESSSNIPAHQIEISYPSFTSNKHPTSAKLLTDYYAGRTARTILSERTSPWPFKWEWNIENKHSYTSTYSESFKVAYSTGRSISLIQSIDWYGAGAAHPNSYFRSHNFLITENDELHKLTLTSFLYQDNYRVGIDSIKSKIIQELPALYWNKTQQKTSAEDIRTFAEGVLSSDLSCFTFDSDGLYFYFSPYELHCYALGNWIVFVPYFNFIDYINPEGAFSLVR